MARTIPWRARCPPEVHHRLSEVASSGLLVVQQPGPTCFVLKSPETQRKVKVLIGDTHSCQCADSKKELCIHILFVLAKVFRVPPDNPLIWQRSYLEAEIEQLLRGRLVQFQRRAGGAQRSAPSEGLVQVPRRPIEEGDMCPICCDDIDDTKPLVYCRYGCGNSIHASCFKAYATHNATNPEPLKCPLCRDKWGPINGDASTPSHNVACSECRAPIYGERYRCAFCSDYNLCSTCFACPMVHPQHPFDVTQEPGGRFQPANRPTRQTSVAQSVQLPEQAPVDPRLAALQQRELGPEDYEELMRLEERAVPRQGEKLTEDEVSRLTHLMFDPSVTEHTSCPICLEDFNESDLLIALPLCTHVFHAACGAKWLTESKAKCPIDNCDVPAPPPPAAQATATSGSAPSRSTSLVNRSSSGPDAAANQRRRSSSQRAQQQQPSRTQGRVRPQGRLQSGMSAPAPLMLLATGIGVNSALAPSTVNSTAEVQRVNETSAVNRPRGVRPPIAGGRTAVSETNRGSSGINDVQLSIGGPVAASEVTPVVVPSETRRTTRSELSRPARPSPSTSATPGQRAGASERNRRGGGAGSAPSRPTAETDGLFVGLSSAQPHAGPTPSVSMPLGGRPSMLRAARLRPM